ncbi:hypothetical protein [Niveispirillum irakense]|uniref:hypothetical protein n=1 Tax=Niveispirillum irakense TaxID=34011 RepID=UPI0012B591C8|nr:hypothetical protein [Niveispirillum irakense]
MMRPILLSFACLALAGLAACSHADKPTGPGPGPGGGGGGFGRIPTSPAGELLGSPVREEAEYVAALTGWFQRVDTDRDGALSPAEVAADTATFFALLDQDGDRGVNARELADYRMRQARPPRQEDNPPAPGSGPNNAAGPRRQGPEGGPPPGNRPGGMGVLAEDKVMAADRNLDFRVTLDELTLAAQQRVAAMDTDKDGRVTLAEVQAAAIKAFNEKPARGGPGARGGQGGGGPPGGGGRRPPQ